MAYSDADLLKIVGEERKRSIGFGEGDGGELTAARNKAIAYAKGEMADVQALPNRSRAVDTAVADAIETVLPDVIEIFVGGDDVATFVPQGEKDEKAAQEEGDFVTHVVMVENPGFLNLYTAFKDALLTRTGILHWWMEDEEKEEIHGSGLTEELAQVAMTDPRAPPGVEMVADDNGTFSLKTKSLHGRVKIKAFPSEDFSCAADTVILRDGVYCVVRDRPRVQELIARGIDAEKARALPSYTTSNEEVTRERDHAGEHDTPMDGAAGDLRVVEVRAHYIRLDMEGSGKLQVWRVITDAEEQTLLDKEMVDHVPFAALTPYIVPHRFYGESVADKLIEVQKIQTALLRAGLDDIYFALNQRMEVDMSKANDFTIADLLRNEPGVPIRVKQGGAVTAVSAGPLNADPWAAMEHTAVIAEKRSGIVRNAQGLNPDTLHKTAAGAAQLIMAAQKRVRMIARIFAETGVKDLFLGVHCLMRTGYTDKHAPTTAKLRNTWKETTPNTWPERCAMNVHVGIGSAGRDHDLIVAAQRLEMMQATVMQQGGLSGPMVTAENLHAALTDWERAAGSKKADEFWSDPAAPNAPKPEPKQDPEMAKVQGQLQLQQGKAQGEMQLAQGRAQADLQLQAAKHQADAQASEQKAIREHELAMTRLQAEMGLKRDQIASELELKREQLTAELQLKRELGMAQAAVAHETGMAKVNASTSQVEPGGAGG